MNKINGVTLSNQEVFILQKLLAHLLDTSDNNEVAKKVTELKSSGELLFPDKLGVGFFMLDFIKYDATNKEV